MSFSSVIAAVSLMTSGANFDANAAAEIASAPIAQTVNANSGSHSFSSAIPPEFEKTNASLHSSDAIVIAKPAVVKDKADLGKAETSDLKDGKDFAAKPIRPSLPDMNRDVRCVAMAVYHEARGESLKGQKAVADVVMNRTRSGKWGRNPCSVVDAPRQFSNRSSWSAPRAGVPAWDRAISIAKDAVSGAVHVSSRLLNFRAARMGAGGRSPLRIGAHIFW